MHAFARTLGLAAAIGFGLVGEAQAHAHLLSATPAANATIATAPAELDLKFSEGLDLRFSGVVLTGPAGAAVPIGSARLATGDDTLLIVPIAGTLVGGSYAVEWHALAADGHKTQGRYVFTVKP